MSLVLHVRLRCGSLSIKTPVSFLANKFDVRSVLHGQVCLAAVNQICVLHEAMNGCKNLKIHKRIFFENINILQVCKSLLLMPMLMYPAVLEVKTLLYVFIYIHLLCVFVNINGSGESAHLRRLV